MATHVKATCVSIFPITHNQLEIHGCILGSIASDVRVVKY